MIKVKKAGVDAGNNGTKIAIAGSEYIYIPSNISYHMENSISDDFSETEFNIDTLHENIDVTIFSPALDTKERYVVGEKAFRDQLQIIEMEENSEKDKHDIPVVTTLSGLAIDAIRSNVDKIDTNKEEVTIKANYDISVALPIKTITKPRAQQLEKKYIGTHIITFHISKSFTIKIEITIEFCKCLPEGAAASWGIVYNEKGELIKHKISTFIDVDKEKIEEITLENRMILGFDVGGGTIEKVVTQGVALQARLSDGLPYGTKKTIQETMSVWNRNNPRKSIDSMIEFNNIYFNSQHPRHSAVVDYFSRPLMSLALQLAKDFVDQIDKLKDDPIIFIYGGGAHLLKTYLIKILNDKGISNVIYLNDPLYANAQGLLVYTLSPRYDEVKQKTLEVV